MRLTIAMLSVFSALAVLPRFPSAVAAQEEGDPGTATPDPATVVRYGAGYRYPKAGWIVLHIEGAPYERGFQHGFLLAGEIVDHVGALARTESSRDAAGGWAALRRLSDALFLRRFDTELLEEMRGIADGAAAAGALIYGQRPDLLDIVAVNCGIETHCLDDALHALPTGLESRRFAPPDIAPPPPADRDHCSAFAATAPATKDGGIVFGHITMFSLRLARHYNVWLDLRPAAGQRILMQTYPGGIQSGMDYAMNDAGLLLAETTIAQTPFNPAGLPVAARARRALQNARTIDEAVAILAGSNNGLYTNEWLLGDVDTGEVALFELGTRASKLWRSSRNEWIGGAEGFYWGCNNAKDLSVRLDTVADPSGPPEDVTFRPSNRDRAWLRLYDAHRGRIDEDFAVKAFTTAPLASRTSLDAKFTTTALARDLRSRALFGPPLGRVWRPLPEAAAEDPALRPLVPNDWTVLGPAAAPAAPPAAVEDLGTGTPAAADPLPDNAGESPLWRGTLLPASDADHWLAAGSATLAGILAESAAATVSGPGDPLRDLLLFGQRSRYLAAVRRQDGSDARLRDIAADFRSSNWHDIAAGKGTLLLAELRRVMGADRFDPFMDAFCGARAGKPAATADFVAAAVAAGGAGVESLLEAWLGGTGLPRDAGGSAFTVTSFLEEPAETAIVWGSRADAAANRAAAEALSEALRVRGIHIAIPVHRDEDATDKILGSNHVLLVGRPAANSVTARFASALPLAFEAGSLRFRDAVFGHADTAVVVAADNPLSPRRSVVLFAGLSAAATWAVASDPRPLLGPPAEILLFPRGGPARRHITRPAEPAAAPPGR